MQKKGHTVAAPFIVRRDAAVKYSIIQRVTYENRQVLKKLKTYQKTHRGQRGLRSRTHNSKRKTCQTGRGCEGRRHYPHPVRERQSHCPCAPAAGYVQERRRPVYVRSHRMSALLTVSSNMWYHAHPAGVRFLIGYIRPCRSVSALRPVCRPEGSGQSVSLQPAGI